MKRKVYRLYFLFLRINSRKRETVIDILIGPRDRGNERRRGIIEINVIIVQRLLLLLQELLEEEESGHKEYDKCPWQGGNLHRCLVADTIPNASGFNFKRLYQIYKAFTLTHASSLYKRGYHRASYGVRLTMNSDALQHPPALIKRPHLRRVNKVGDGNRGSTLKMLQKIRRK